MQTQPAPQRRATLRAQVQAQDLKRALERVKPAVRSRAAGPAQRGVLIGGSRRGLTLCATDGDLTIRTSVPGEVSSSGTILVPYAQLNTVVGRRPGAVSLRASGDALAVTAGSTRAHLAAMDVENFSAPVPNGFGVSIPLDLSAIRRVLPAVSTDKSRPLLQAVLLNGTDIVATDSYRLHLERVPDPLPRCLLPKSVLAALAATRHRTVDFTLDEVAGLAQLAVPDTDYVVRTPPSDWVDYRHLVPRPADITIIATARAKDLLGAAVQLRPLTTSTSPPPPAWLVLESDRITVSVDVADVGRGEVEIPATVEGAEGAVHVAFNLAFLAGCVRACDTERVSLHLRDPRKPVVIVGASADWDQPGTGLRLLMPMLLPPPGVASVPTTRTAATDTGNDDSGDVATADRVLARRTRRTARRRAAR